MPGSRRADVATATVGAGGVAAGGVLRHRGLERTVAGSGKYPKVHLAAVLSHGDRRAKTLYLGGSALGLLSAAPLAVGVHNATRPTPMVKRDSQPKSFLREGLEGSASALQERGDNLRQSVPAKVRAAQLGAAGGAGFVGGRLASLALRKHPGLKPGLAPVAGALVATGTIPLTNKVVNRVDPGYKVTPAGVMRAKKTPKRPSSMASTYRSEHRSFRQDVGKADSYTRQRGIVTGAGAAPIVGPFAQAATAARYAPPGQQHKAAARQFGMGPAAGFTAGVGAAYAGARAADKSPRFAARATQAIDASTHLQNKARSMVGMGPKTGLNPDKMIGRAVGRAKTMRAVEPLVRNKARAAGAAAAFLGTKAVVGGVGGQAAISLNQRDQKRWNKTAVGKAVMTVPGTKHDQHRAAQRKKLNARLSTATGLGSIASLALLGTKHKAKAIPLSMANSAVGGANSLLYARVTRREARVADPYDPLSKRDTDDSDDLKNFVLELRSAGLRLRPSAPAQFKPLRVNRTLARVKAMDAESRERYFATKNGRAWLARNSLGRTGRVTWGPEDAKTNLAWRQRAGFTGQPRPRNTTGYRGSGKPYGMSKGYPAELPYKGPKYVYHQTLGRLRIMAAHPEGRFTVDSKSGTRLMHRDQIWPKKPKPDNGQMDLFEKAGKFPGHKPWLTGGAGLGSIQPFTPGMSARLGRRYDSKSFALRGDRPRPPMKTPEQLKDQNEKAVRAARASNEAQREKRLGDHRARQAMQRYMNRDFNLEKRDQREPLKTSVSEDDARKLIGRHGLTGPLPKDLDRNQRMAAYEARYVSAGGRKAEHWQRRAQRADKVKTVGLAGATAGGAAWLAGRGRLGRHLGSVVHAKAPGLKRVDAKTFTHHAETLVGASATAGGAGELYAGHARRKRSSYASAPAGVAASALRRMQAYTPGSP